VSNLYVRQTNLKVILELTGSQCSSDRRAVAGCCERLGKTTRATEACTRCSVFDVGGTVDKRVYIVDACVDKGSSYCLRHVVCECLPDVTDCIVNCC